MQPYCIPCLRVTLNRNGWITMALNKIDIGNEMSRGWALFQLNTYCMMACAHETCFGAGAAIGTTATEPPPTGAAR